MARGRRRGCTAIILPVFVIALVIGWVLVTGERARLAPGAGFGPNPRLPEARTGLVPTVSIAEAVGWPEGGKPTPAPGFAVLAFADNLDHPRWLLVLPNGDVLVAETNAPRRPRENKGLKGRITALIMKRAGAGVPSANRITLLRDKDGDGVAETRSVFLSGLNSPFGMALVGGDFYVANTDGVDRYAYTEGATALTGHATRIFDLPAGPRNHHWTKGLVASPDGRLLYASVGSNSNVAEHGMDAEEGRAAIWQIDPATKQGRIFASGLRNPVGMAFEPGTGTLWTAVNERDELGSDLVPDYMTSVRAGGFYGWPWSWYGRRVDKRVEPARPDMVARALVPDYALGAHTASLGLAFHAGGALVAQHGSWNRRPPAGYKLIFVRFRNGRPTGLPVDILTAFLGPDGKARGRPVGVVTDRSGAILLADDVGNRIWRVTRK